MNQARARSPGVGQGGLGTLQILGKRYLISVPAGVQGVLGEKAGGQRQALGYGDPLFRLDGQPGAATSPTPRPGQGPEGSSDGNEEAWAITAPIDGIFYQRPSPEAPPYVAEGDEIAPGAVLGLIEVMKTFNPVRFPPGGSQRARIKRIDAPDPGEVRAGALLFVLEAASGPGPD